MTNNVNIFNLTESKIIAKSTNKKSNFNNNLLVLCNEDKNLNKISNLSIDNFDNNTNNSANNNNINSTISSNGFNENNIKSTLLPSFQNKSSKFTAKNIKKYENEKGNLINYLLCHEGKYSDLEKIEEYTLAKVHEKNKEYNNLLSDTEKKEEILNKLDIEIKKLIINKTELSDLIEEADRSFNNKINNITKKIKFAEFSYSNYKSIKAYLSNDRVLIQKKLEVELSLSKLNSNQYDKYIVIKDNSSKTYKLQGKLLEEMKYYAEQQELQLSNDLNSKFKTYLKLEKDQEKINEKNLLNKKKLEKIKAKKDIIMTKINYYDKIIIEKKNDNNKILKQYSIFNKKLINILIVIKSENINEAINRIIVQKTANQSYLSFFKFINKDIKNLNSSISDLDYELYALNKILALEKSNFKINNKLIFNKNKNANLEEFSFNNSVTNCLVQNEVNLIRLNIASLEKFIEKKEEFYLFLITFFCKYESVLLSCYFFIISNIFNVSEIDLKKTHKVYRRNIKSFPKYAPTIKDKKDLITYFINFAKLIIFMFSYSLIYLNKENVVNSENLVLQDQIYNKLNKIKATSSVNNVNNDLSSNNLNNKEIINVSNNCMDIYIYYPEFCSILTKEYGCSDVNKLYNKNINKIKGISLNIPTSKRSIINKKEDKIKLNNKQINEESNNYNHKLHKKKKIQTLIYSFLNNSNSNNNMLFDKIYSNKNKPHSIKNRNNLSLNNNNDKHVSINENKYLITENNFNCTSYAELFKSKLYCDMIKLTNNLVDSKVKNYQFPNINNNKINKRISNGKFIPKSKLYLNCKLEFSNAQANKNSNKASDNLNSTITTKKSNKLNRSKSNKDSITSRSHFKYISNKDDSFENYRLNQDIEKNTNKNKVKKLNIIKSLPKGNNDTAKIYHRMADIQYLNLNLFKQGLIEGEFKVENNDFNRIYTRFKAKLR